MRIYVAVAAAVACFAHVCEIRNNFPTVGWLVDCIVSMGVTLSALTSIWVTHLELLKV